VAKKKDATEDLVAAALRLAETRGWRRLSLLEVAKEAGVSLAEAYARLPSKAHLLEAILAGVDRQVLAAGPAADGDSPRDRLFEVLMRRFDAMQERRAGYLAILNDVILDPFSLVPALPAFARSMTWMLEAAAIPTDGPVGNLRAKALAAVYLNVLRTWRTDDSVDLARTMAALDRSLRQIESMAERCPALAGGASRPRASDSSPAAPEDGDSGGEADARPADA
jgi:AcrR family transcriptional regulator